MKSVVLLLFMLAAPVMGYSEDSIYKASVYYLNRIIVEKSDINLKKVAKFESGNRVNSSSWDKFPINNFDSITYDHPHQTYSTLRKHMIKICQEKGLDTLSLNKCLDVIKKEGDTYKYVILPIAGYFAKFGKSMVWIIRCRWEWESILPGFEYEKKYPQLTYEHERTYAIDPDNLKIVAFWTCE